MVESQFHSRHIGARWSVRYGDYSGVSRFTVQEFQRVVQTFLPYVLPVNPDLAENVSTDGHQAWVGTAANHRGIAELLDSGSIAPPPGAQGYTVASITSPRNAEQHLLVVAGADEAGTLYGVQELARHLAAGYTGLDGDAGRRKYFDTLSDFTFSAAPAIAYRGIWTWGYVIYDYRRFLDQMARLKMNQLVVWNDCVPVNAEELLEYAHARGIQVIFGFHWGWGFEGNLELLRAGDRETIRERVLATYREQYAGLHHDGIYFQTLTEYTTQEIAGHSVASWAAMLVNETAQALLQEFPDTPIYFGLHATSIRDHYRDLVDLDPRVTITWEDAGSLPYSYVPTEIDGYEETLAYSQAIASFRPDTAFSLVPKGWMTLRWFHEFENHGPFLLGERTVDYPHDRLRARQPEWNAVNASWYRHFPLASRFYREMLVCNPRLMVTGLIEDGLFENVLQPSVALFAETLWNPHQSDADLLARATRPSLLSELL